MAMLQHKRLRMQSLLYPLLIAAILGYILFHALHGDYGFYALIKEQRRATFLQERYGELHMKRNKLEQHTQLLSESSLDLDFLDERARIVLGYANKEEAVHLAQ